ncbi:hypothetical protein B0H16DRAFT_1900781 [Mycena metata]|uniref:Uncharacterized protein n=1 Tax=Mycena metata TaxID=1033252 RepID=A0AAD7H306_9AGAR|nr:hypothetical protein B0H16DRAFT_1900781 [Mycena metata]
MALLPSPSGSLRDSGHLRSPVASPEPSVTSPEFSLGHTNNCGTIPGCLLLLGYASGPLRLIIAPSLASKNLNQRHLTSSADDTENTHPDDFPALTETTTTKYKKSNLSLKVQIIKKDARIAELEANLSELTTELGQLRVAHDGVCEANRIIQAKKCSISNNNQYLNSLKRKADHEVAKKQKRIKRLERERDLKKEEATSTLANFDNTLYDKLARISHIERDLDSARSQIHSQNEIIASLRTSLQQRQYVLTAVRKLLYAAQKRVQRQEESLKTIRALYNALRVWNATTHGQYTTVARELARALTYAGCAAGKIEYAVKACAKAFGIRICRRFMSTRTVARAIDEGGKYGILQVGQEIMNAPGFIKSSDGTTLHGVPINSRHITLLAPSYAPGIDDTDQSTWTHKTRFLEVAPELDHTAETHNELWTKTITGAKRWARTRTTPQMGKRNFAFLPHTKRDIVVGDLRRDVMADANVDTAHILLTILSISDEDLQTAGKISESELAALSSEARSELVEQVLEQKLGEEKFETMTEDEQSNLCTHFFGGCCAHKDLNVLEYGYKSIQRTYSTHDLPPPVLLANKANSATIAATDDPDNMARKTAIESSSAGAIKLLQLIGALLRHKDRQRGYQDRMTMFMREKKLELYNLEQPTKFPDVSNTRYGCYSYAAAEVVTFHGLIATLVQEICNGKTKSGQENHVEHNVLKGLNCPVTLTELVALALYGASVSWPYMATVRGTKANPINLLDLTDIHCKLPSFCAHLSAHPQSLLDPNTPLSELTLDGLPFRDPLLLDSIRQLLPDLKNPFLIISRVFSGAETGWILFTPEFHIGGTIDRLTPEQRHLLFVLSTNDCSEGVLGANTVHAHYHPNSTTHSFSNQTQTERNNTEAFIKKCCDAEVEKFVIREVRKDGKRNLRAKFRREWLARQREKAEKALQRRERTVVKKKAAVFRLATTILKFSISKIRAMTSKQLKEQLQYYKDELKDEVLVKKKWKDMSRVGVRDRELARRGPGNPHETPPEAEEPIAVNEYGYIAGEDDKWEDTDSE